MAGFDGSLRFNTELDNEGFDRGSRKLSSAIDALKRRVANVGEAMRRGFSGYAPILREVGAAASEAASSVTAAAQESQAVIDSRTVDMPNFLNDVPDQTQKFVYQVGLNGAPTVMDQQQFDQFMQQNNIPRSQIMSRSVNKNGPYSAQQIVNIFKYSELTYIGGKQGGQMSGAGTYFDMNGGGSTGYGSGATMLAVYNPATARVIDYHALQRQAASFARSHPKFARAVGSFTAGRNGNASIYALAMGYNAISGGPVSHSYQNIIDRSAVVVVK